MLHALSTFSENGARISPPRRFSWTNRSGSGSEIRFPENPVKWTHRRSSSLYRGRDMNLSHAPGRPGARCPRVDGLWAGGHQRFRRWAKASISQMIFNTLAINADAEWLMIDATIIRALQRTAGAKGEADAGFRALRGRIYHEIASRVRCVGQFAPVHHGGGRTASFVHKPRRCWGGIHATGALVVIPPRGRNRTVLREYDKALYKKRNQVEGMVGDLKHFSRVAVRQDSAHLPSSRPVTYGSSKC